MAKQIKYTDIQFKIKTGTVRDLMASWKFNYTPEKHIASYDWEWQSFTNGKWVDGGSGSTTHPLHTAEFTAPDDAKAIKFRVRPVSKTNEDTDLSGVDKDNDSKSTVTHYFQGSWSDWRGFKSWYKVTVPDDFSVGKIKIKKIAAAGGGFDLRAYHNITKKDYEKHLPFLSGFEYKWQGWDGRDWTDAEGTVDSIMNGETVVMPETASSGTIELSVAAKNLVLAGNTLTVNHKIHLQSTYKAYRIKIKPTPSNEFDFLPIERTQTKDITAPVKRLKKKQIFVKTRNDDNNFYVFWYVTDKSFFENEDGVEVVSGFDVEWQYMKDVSVWNSSGGVPSGGYWLPGGTETVDLADKVKYKTTTEVETEVESGTTSKKDTVKTSGKLADSSGEISYGSATTELSFLVNKKIANDVLTTTYGGTTQSFKAIKVEEVTAYQWCYVFALPDGVKRDTVAQIRIKVKATESATFTEEWSSWIECSRKIPEEQLDSTLVYLYPSASSARHIEALWTKFDMRYTAGFSYAWFYKIAEDNIYRPGSTGTVDISQTTVGTVEKKIVEIQNGGQVVDTTMTLDQLRVSDLYKWMTSYDAPEEAVSVFLELSAVPDYDGAYVPRIIRKSHDISIPSMQVENVVLAVDDAETKTLIASWTPIADERVQSYECVWEYYLRDIWREGQTGSTAKSSVGDLHGETVSTPYSTFVVPDEDVTEVRFAVRPTASSEDVFKGDWGNYHHLQVVPVRLILSDVGGIYVARDPQTARGVFASYASVGTIPEEVENLTFEWSYFLNGEWRLGETEGATVEYPNSTYEVPANAEIVRVRVKPEIDTLNYIGDWSEYLDLDTVIPPRTIDEDAIVVRPFRGSDRSVIAMWGNDTNYEGIANFTCRWRKYLSGVWSIDNDAEVSLEDSHSIYQVPERVYKVSVQVRPNPEYEMDFKGEWSNEIVLDVQDDVTPAVPSTPTLELKKNTYTFTASLDTYDRNTKVIRFEVVDDTLNSIWSAGDVEVSFNRVTYSFTGLAGHGYKVRAIGINADNQTMGDIGETGEDGWSQYSSIVYARPNAPSFTAITAENETSIVVEFTEVENADSYELEYSKKSAYFDTGGPVTSVSSTVNLIHLVDIESNDYYFRVRAVNDAGNSDWSEIAQGSCGKVPKSPTTWSSRLNATIDSDIFLYWTHNSEDGSKERSAKIEIIVNGTTHEVIQPKGETDTTQSSYKLPPEYTEDAGVIQWRVCTMGIEAMGYGDWSTQRMIKIYSPPAVGISLANSNTWTWDDFNFNEDSIYSADGDRNVLLRNVIEAFPILIYLDAGPVSQTPVAYSLTITSNNSYETSDVVGNPRRISRGQVIFSRYLNTNKHSLVTMIMPGEIDIENGMSYTLHVTLAMDSGLTAENSITFSVSWEEADYDIGAEIGFNRRDLIAYVTPYCNDENGVRVSDATLSVYRKEFDGRFTLLADNISSSERPTVTDPHPNLDYARYRVVARSNTTGKTEFYDIPGYKVGVTSIILQWDETQVSYDAMNLDERAEMTRAGSMIRLPYNVDVSDSNQVDVEMVEYIGRSHPVSYFGTQVGQKASWSAVIPKTDKQTIYDLRRLARYMGNVYVREPSGTGYWAHVEVSFNLTHLETVVPVNLSVTRVEGGM